MMGGILAATLSYTAHKNLKKSEQLIVENTILHIQPAFLQ